MATTTTQGNSEAPSYPANTCNSVYVYVTASCATVAVGCTLYYDSSRTIKMPAGTYKVEYANDNKWKFTVDANGVVTAATRCAWYSNQTYSEMWTGTKNNCSIGSCTSVVGSTVTLNDNGNNVFVTGGTYTSYISQADADSMAYTSAYNDFQSGKQNKVNEYGYCTWTYSSGSGSYTGYYTKNNCGSNCYGSASIAYSNTQSGYSAQSTTSCQDAINTANSAAYNQAVAVVQANGQNHANSVGSCCCWNYEEYCSGCQRRSRERNSCTNELRNDALVGNNSCSCGNTCNGTYAYYYCAGTTRYVQNRNNCDGSDNGAATVVAYCSTDCTSTAPIYTSQGYTTCYNCTNANVYKDTNSCSGTYNSYYVYYNGYVYFGGPPTGGSCNTGSNCVDTGSAYCSGANYVINRTQGNPCSGEGCSSPRVIEYNSTTYGCYTPPSCTLYELYMYGGYSEYVYVSYTPCSGGSSTMSAYNDGGGGYGGQVCAQNGTAYISSGSGALINQGSCS